jgi:4-amino-4-deoxy-L-arabinose transferase-like glycosyltransferase
MPDRRTTYHWTAALIAGAALRLLLFHFRPAFSNDGILYAQLAHNMVAHHVFGFTNDVIRPTLIRLPGYPIFLAACFALFGNANFLAVLWMQMAIDLASAAILATLAARLGGRRVGVAAIWLAALCPFTANYSVALLTETLSLASVILAFFALERWDTLRLTNRRSLAWAALAGAALSFAVLLRPDQGLLAAAVIPTMLWIALRSTTRTFTSTLLPATIASLILILPLLAWTARNWRAFHVIQPLAPRYANDPGETVPYGFQRWYRTWAIDFDSTYDVYWNYDDTTLNLADLPPRAFDNAQQRAQTETIYTQYNQVTTATPAFDQAFAKIATDRIAAHPLRYYFELPVARELNMWLRPRTELMRLPIKWWQIRAHPKRSAFEIVYALLNAATLALALTGLFIWRARRWNGRRALAYSMLAFVALRCLLLLTLDNSEPRYTLECFPIVILFASFAFARRDPISDSRQSYSCPS